MKSGNVEIRHIQGRTVRVEGIKRYMPSDEEEKTYQAEVEAWKDADYVSPIYPKPGRSNHTMTHWTVSVLSVDGWTRLLGFDHISPDHAMDKFDHYFDEAGAVL